MINQYINTNLDRFISELCQWLKIASVSADPNKVNEMHQMAEICKNSFLNAGANHAEIISTKGFPVVYAEKIISPLLPTVLVYGHYDVQPADPIDLWTSPPFEPVIKDGKVFARGACDDKGQVYMHVKALETMIQTGTLACNIKYMIEGEEEVGSAHLSDFIIENKEKLKADIILISDTSIVANDCPSITVGLRGLSYLEVEVKGPNKDLHSGVFGGAVPNPINILCEMIASLKNTNQSIAIPGFYDDVVILTENERKELNKKPYNNEEFKSNIGIRNTTGELGFTTTERTSIRPTLDVNGVWGGYTGEGAKTVIASKAFAKISMRLVANQDPEKITKLFEEHFRKIAPDSVEVNVKPHHGGNPVRLNRDSKGYKAASMAMKESFGKEPIPTSEGGSIPIVSLFKKELELDTVLLGFGLDSDAIHSPNEHYGIYNFKIGIETICLFHKYFNELSK